MLSVEFKSSAKNDLRAIVDYLSDYNLDAADAFVALFKEKLEQVRCFPDSARVGRVAGTRELVLNSSYIVVYRLQENRLQILRLLHCSQQYP